MKSLLTIAALTLSTASFADGFKCETIDGNYKIKLFNKVMPIDGTRNPSVMVISDTSVATAGHKTVAVFNSPKTLTVKDGVFVGRVDLRFNDSGRKGENVFGTKLGHIKTIKVDVDFTYGNPVKDDAHLTGLATITKRNGQEVLETLDCSRYLKN